jgi:glycosyltransferase involved in cell wall biosynthesis
LKPNVLQLIGSFYEGGSERQALQLSRLLRDDGRYTVHIACLDAGGALREEAEDLSASAIPEFRLNCFYDRNMVVQLGRFAGLLKERRISVVHSHDFYTNVFGMAGAALARVPVRIASRRESVRRPRVQRIMERAAFQMASAVVANCEEVRRQLLDEGLRPDKANTVYNGLDMARVSPDAGLNRVEILRSFGLPEQSPGPFVTIVANMRNEMKDYPTFIRAARRVHDAVPAARFVLAGEGPLLEGFREDARDAGLADLAHFIGRCDRIADLLSVTDVCTLSSKTEGFSNSILEYMAAGRPVAATDVGGAREAIVEGETGYLVPAGDDEALAGRIVSLLHDPDRARSMGDRGRALIENQFSCEAQLQRTEALYRRLLDRTDARLPVVEPMRQATTSHRDAARPAATGIGDDRR